MLFDRAVFHKHAMKIETVDFIHVHVHAHVYSVVLRMHKCIRIISKLTRISPIYDITIVLLPVLCALLYVCVGVTICVCRITSDSKLMFYTCTVM